MEDFRKVIRPGIADKRDGSVFCKIEFAAGRLSISGVEGPKSNGDARGSCGQIVMHLLEREAPWAQLAEGWTPELVAKFLETWDRWHLNDMRAYDSEMREAGWHELAQRPILKFRFTLTREAMDAKRAAEKAAGDALRAGASFTPTPEQVAAAARPYSLEIYAYPMAGIPADPEHYQRARSIHTGDVEHPERKTLGWVRPAEHPDGLLTRKLRPDGPGYGSAWFREEVPADVLAFLRGLPDADRAPAWV